MKKVIRDWLLFAACVMLCAATLPRRIAGRDARALYAGKKDLIHPLARKVAANLQRGVSRETFSALGPRFGGEWAVATYQMGVLGLGQIILADPSGAPRELRAAVTRACQRLRDPELRAFGVEAWSDDAFESDRGHAYIGYVALALAMEHAIDPSTPRPELELFLDKLATRLAASPFALYETYPRESYPIDVSATVGALGLYQRATRTHKWDALITKWEADVRARYVDRRSGYLVQRADHENGQILDGPRASGTALASYFLSFAAPALSRDLGRALLRDGHATFLGFGGTREYPRGAEGSGDVDSGPVLFGIGVSATGFAIGAARSLGEEERFTELYRTAHLFGAPFGDQHRRGFLFGTALGESILLAMITAPSTHGPRSR